MSVLCQTKKKKNERASNGVVLLARIETQPVEWATLPPTMHQPRRRDRSGWGAMEKSVRTRAASSGRGQPLTRSMGNPHVETEQQECLDKCDDCCVAGLASARARMGPPPSLIGSKQTVRPNRVSYRFVFAEAARADLHRNFWSSRMP